MKKSDSLFEQFSHRVTNATGSTPAFIVALGVILVWAATGPLFHYSDTWQLVINTGTTIVTFLMVFLIQNTQNRDAVSLHLKLDELIRALKGARNKLIDLDELSDEELEELRQEFHRLGAAPLPPPPKKQKV
jgi:low affinity Fe/Cu permease